MPTTNLEHEIIANILQYPDSMAKIKAILPLEAFFDDRNRLIFQSCKKLHDLNQPITIGVVVADLEKVMNNEVDWIMYISEVMDSLSAEEFGEKQAEVLLEKFILTETSKVMKKMLSKIDNETVKSTEIFSELQDYLLDLASKSKRIDFTHIQNVLTNVQNDAKDMLFNEGIGSQSYSTGYDDLDKIIHGFKKGQMIILAGRPGMGKTTLSLNLIKHFATRFIDKSILIISRETNAEELSVKILSAKTYLTKKTIEDGRWYRPTGETDKNNQIKILHAMEELKNSKIFYDDSISIDLNGVVSNIIKFSNKTEVGLIVVDYLQLLESRENRGRTREQEVAKVSRSLKQLALRLKCPILALSQLSRKTEIRERPLLSDLRESGSLEQDADVVMLMHSQEMKAEKPETNDTIERVITDIIVAKNRNGPTGEIKLIFNKQFSSFTKYVNEGT